MNRCIPARSRQDKPSGEIEIMKNRFEFEPHTLPPTMARDLQRLRDKGPIVSYGENAVDRQQPDFEPAPTPQWHQPLSKAPRE